jgi:hypothetical protein
MSQNDDGNNNNNYDRIIRVDWYTLSTVNDNKLNITLKKLEFESQNEVKYLVKGNQYDELVLPLEKETELDIDKSPIKNEQNKIIIRVTRIELDEAILKNVKLLDYEHSFSKEDEITSNYKYTIIAQDIQIKKISNKIYTDFKGKK